MFDNVVDNVVVTLSKFFLYSYRVARGPLVAKERFSTSIVAILLL